MKFLSKAALAAGLMIAAGQFVSSGSALAAVITDASDPLLSGASVITFDEAPLGTTNPTIGNVSFIGDRAPLKIQRTSPFKTPELFNPLGGGTLGTSFSIIFDIPVLAFAMDIMNFSDLVTIEAYGANDLLLGSVDYTTPPGGIEDTYGGLGGFASAISNVRIITSDLIVLDNFSFTTAATAPGPVAVAEPASLALFGLGLAGLGFVRRTRKTS